MFYNLVPERPKLTCKLQSYSKAPIFLARKPQLVTIPKRLAQSKTAKLTVARSNLVEFWPWFMNDFWNFLKKCKTFVTCLVFYLHPKSKY